MITNTHARIIHQTWLKPHLYLTDESTCQLAMALESLFGMLSLEYCKVELNEGKKKPPEGGSFRFNVAYN